MSRPSDCTLLLAVPTDRGEFERAWDRGTDFIRTFGGTHPRDAVWARYEPYSRLCQEVIRDVTAAGVVVQREAQLGDLAAAIGPRKTVTVVAHSRDAVARPQDIRDPADVVDRAKEIAEQVFMATDARIPLSRADDVAAWLNELLDASTSQVTAGLSQTETAALFVWRSARRWDLWRATAARVPGALASAAGVEFTDGFESIESIDAAVPIDLGECLDLTVCESALLAEVLRRRRASGVILANVEPTTLDFRLSFYRQVIRLMKHWNGSFPEIVLKLRSHVRRKSCRD